MAEAEIPRAACGQSSEAIIRVISGLRRSDTQAQADLCELFGRDIQKFVARRLREHSDLAEDIMVQTLVDAIRNIARFDSSISTFRAWLFGIARRHMHGELHLQARRTSIPARALVPIDALRETGGDDFTEASMERLEAKRQVAALTTSLSELEMEVLVLRCVHQFSLKEIGQVVGRSERAVDSLLNRAKQKARERLGHDHD